MTFTDLFRAATGNDAYPYQHRFAIADELPALLSVPTGVGKTATAVLAWLWRRRFATDETRETTPRRLVYCLPMRTLVEQTRDECVKWLDALDLLAGSVQYDSREVESFELDLNSEEHSTRIGVHTLMGGEDGERWDEFPERDAIIIGTQDMLLSRALNRGYGMSRYRWPMHFGLLNNDCLWVLDETQLMGVGLTTSCQLAGLREKLNTYGRCQTLWMSATLDNDALNTVDHPRPDSVTEGLSLDEKDRQNGRVAGLLTAAKSLSAAAVQLTPDSAKKGYEEALATNVTDRHRPGTLTLVVVNSVARAQELFTRILGLAGEHADCIKLIHSRFRPHDRKKTQNEALNESTIMDHAFGRIVIATQAIEAGVDISATTMFTELAPWSSLVQRFGRCNRRGVCGRDGNPAANVYWIDFDTSDPKKAKVLGLPYEVEALDAAREQLHRLDDVGPQSLDGISVEEPEPLVHVLRKKDLVDLFDTTPDLSGNDLDVSCYIRDGDDTDIQVYWRDWDLKESMTPPKESSDVRVFPAPQRNELCSVSIAQAKSFADKLKKTVPALVWDPLSREWRTIRKNDVRPGLTVLLHASVGGYQTELGWTADTKHKPVAAVENLVGDELDFMDADDNGAAHAPLQLTQHLRDVVFHAERLRDGMPNDELPWEVIVTAARWHDVGKGHEAFQTAMRDSAAIDGDIDDGMLWAKSGDRTRPRYRVARPVAELVGQAVPDIASESTSPCAPATTPELHEETRTGFRHELASALAWLEHNQYAGSDDVNLIAYLIAAHHGKVRLSIRSMPNERAPSDAALRFARGIHEGDALPAVDLGNGESSSAVDSVKLDLMSLGDSESGPSWLSRMLTQRQSHGPFRLAFFEALVRIADWRGSADPNCGGAM